MKPLTHAQASAKRYGGSPDDYLAIHDLMDSSKSAVPDMRHRCIFHSAFGIYVVEKVFGSYITNSEGTMVSVRDVAEDHVKEDLGTIPTLQDWLQEMNVADWMLGPDGRSTRRDGGPRITFDAAIEEMAAAKREAAERGKELIESVIGKFFDDNPRAKIVSWEQYTPYFNDGDVCAFGMREVNVFIDGISNESDSDWDWLPYVPSGRGTSDWSRKVWDEWEARSEEDKDAIIRATEFASKLASVEEFLEAAFGDHVRITARREGIFVEGYTDHD